MKITGIDIMLMTMGAPATVSSPRNPVVLCAHTDEGIYGYGEMGLTYGCAKYGALGDARYFPPSRSAWIRLTQRKSETGSFEPHSGVTVEECWCLAP